MVGTFGMSVSFGRLRPMSQSGGYLGGAATVDEVSDATRAGFDDGRGGSWPRQGPRPAEALEDDGELLSSLIARLQEAKTLEGDELEAFLSRAGHPQPTPVRHKRQRRVPLTHGADRSCVIPAAEG